MILALFGTNPYPFERLVVFLETLAREEGLHIVVQHGSSRAPEGCDSFDYASHQGILDLMAKADVVVAQGGYGSSLDALTLGRPLVLVPRLHDFAESLDDQVELVRYLEASGRALSAQTYHDFAAAVAQALSANCEKPGGQERLVGQAVAQAILDHLETRGKLLK